MSDTVFRAGSQPFAEYSNSQIAASEKTSEEQFLRLHLEPDTSVLLPVQQLAEVLSIPAGQIVAIPHLPRWVMGVYNWRGEVLWMVDLGDLCGLTPWYRQLTSTSLRPTIVLQIAASTAAKKQTLGLVVSRVEDIEWLDPATIQSSLSAAQSIAADLQPFLSGYWWKPNDTMLSVLNGKAILQAMPRFQ